MKLSRVLLLATLAVALSAHPMGDSSVNHYTKITVNSCGAALDYVLDLAENPTAELMSAWKLDRTSAQLQSKAEDQAREWARSLRITVNNRSVYPQFESAAISFSDGKGGQPTARIASRLRLPVSAGKLEFEDTNYRGRPGWKEIVISAAPGASILRATQSDHDRSQGLTTYSQASPPQDLRASVEWSTGPESPKQAPVIAPIATESGDGVRGDYLSQLLNNRQLGLGMTLIGIAVAFGLGAVHALSPGHGKTLVAAYLVGARGTAKHAIFLGGMVTFTHTISVFALGFVTLFLSKYVAPEKISPVLEVISGLSIVWIGGLLLYKRLRALNGHSHSHGHDHDHIHDHHHHDHDHGPHGHSHVPEGEVTMGSLIALGASGGLVPCPSALILLLAAVRFDRVPLGLVLLVGFSAGLAAVLTVIGLAVLYAKHLLPGDSARKHPAFRLLPVLSAGVVLCIGLVMTGISLGVIHPGKVA